MSNKLFCCWFLSIVVKLINKYEKKEEENENRKKIYIGNSYR